MNKQKVNHPTDGHSVEETNKSERLKGNPTDQNTDDLGFEVISESETRTNWNFDNLNFAFAATGELLISQAKNFLHGLLKELGTDSSKPVMAGVFKMFREAMNTPEAENYIPIVERIKQHTPGSFDDLLKAKFTFEKSTHKTQADYLLSRIKAGAGIETAKANWEFAVNSYNENKENAESTFKESVYAARSDNYDKWEKKYSNVANEILAHENHFTYAQKIAAATVNYSTLMSKANVDLTTAFAALMTSLMTNLNVTALTEAALIASNRKDSLALWTAIKTSYNKQFGGSRTV